MKETDNAQVSRSRMIFSTLHPSTTQRISFKSLVDNRQRATELEIQAAGYAVNEARDASSDHLDILVTAYLSTWS